MLKSLTSDEAFGDVPVRVLQQLTDMAAVAQARKGTTIYNAGERWERLGFLVDGSLAMLVTGDDGKERLYEQVEPGHFFGVSSMFDGAPEMARTAVVSRTATYALLDLSHVVKLCRSHGSLAVAFAVTLAQRLRHTTALLSQTHLTAHQRIARYLLQFTVGPGLAPAREPLPLMTQAQIGSAAGTVKEVVGRAVSAFEDYGAVKRVKGHIALIHRELLSELAGFHAASSNR
jgi:CRP-like cAMP-binding protein